MANKTHPALEFQDPGPLPHELMDVPGFINQLKEYTMSVAPRPNEPLAFAGALAMLSHLGGRTFRDERGVGTGLYLAALAPSGMGKECPREVNKRIATAAQFADSLPDSIASGEALEDAMEAHPTLLLQCDEADSLLTSLKGADMQSVRLNEMLLRFFGESNGSHAMRQKAGSGTVRLITNPHLTLFATGISTFFYAALNEKALQNGLLGRCLFIDTETFCPYGEMKTREIPGDIVGTAGYFASFERKIAQTGIIEQIIVPDSFLVEQHIEALKIECDKVTQAFMDNKRATEASLYARGIEKTLKLALVRALSENPSAPRITPECILWGAEVVSHLTRRMLYLAQFHVANNKFDRLKNRTLEIIARNGGKILRSDLLRALHTDSESMQRVIRTLEMCDQVEEEQINVRKVVYTLKNG